MPINWSRRILLGTTTCLLLGASAVGVFAALNSGARGPVRLACSKALTAWCTAFHRSSTASANMLVVGDSIAEGYFAPDRADRWIDLVREHLQSDKGGSGMGYLPASDSAPSSPAFPDIWSEAGGIASYEGLGDRSYTINSATGFAQATVKADRFQLSYTASPTGGAMRIFIDGRQEARLDTYHAGATISGRTWLSPGLIRGTHTIRVVPDDTGHLPVYSVVVEGIMVFNGDDFSGPHMWDGSRSGYDAAEFRDSANFGQDVAQVNPDLLVVELGTNDMQYAVPPSQFASSIASIVTIAEASDSHPMSVVLLLMWDTTTHDAATYGQYIAAEDSLATTQGYAVADLSNVDPTIYSADGIHPNKWGEELVSDTLLRKLDPIFASQVPAPTGPANDPLNLSRPALPGPAQSLSIAAGSTINSVTATWTAPADETGPFDYYTAQLDDVTASSGSITATQTTGGSSATFTGLVAGHRYVAHVAATNPAGSSQAVSSNTLTLASPPPPTNVTATAGTAAGTATVKWTAPRSGSPDSYLVQAFDTTTDRFATQQSVTSTSAMFRGLVAGDSYSFAVYAHNRFGYQSPVGSNTITLRGAGTRKVGHGRDRIQPQLSEANQPLAKV